ncbi:FAD:protein FMN transferase [Alistipes sp. ZOR0009]|uniref:FAD:protein FMN transferase n=1 Tax=Alistipes sp. ZOR0009 TaxID=1339253 RepID=UPI0006462A80|nr:FAD:protein FMN transferase [Alistipes sp. ZOR0009]
MSSPHELQLFSRAMKLMGNRFEISVVAADELWANERIDEAVTEIQRIEELLTTFKDSSQTNRINQNAGIAPVAVDREVFDLISRSVRISALTQGAFDITYGSLDKRFWNFDTKMTSLPDPKVAKQSVSLISYKNVILDNERCTVFLKKSGMRIGFGGIGKGYAADRAKLVMQKNGVASGVVNASGDLTVWGKQPNGDSWTIGVANPDLADESFSSFKIDNASVATSGNYEKFAVIDGKRYSHTIDPKTGFPVSGIKSVTIITTSAELADAMATPVTVMGVKVGLNLINQMRDIACIIITDENQLFCSSNVRIS